MTRRRGRQALRDSTIQTTAAHDALVAACARLDEVGLAPQTRYRLTIALRAMRGFEFRSPDGRLLGSVYTGPARTLVKGEDGRWRDAQGSPVREGTLCHLDGITRGEFDRLFAGSTILLLFPILKTRRARMVHHADVLVGEV